MIGHVATSPTHKNIVAVGQTIIESGLKFEADGAVVVVELQVLGLCLRGSDVFGSVGVHSAGCLAAETRVEVDRVSVGRGGGGVKEDILTVGTTIQVVAGSPSVVITT